MLDNVHIDCFGMTDQGRQREDNQDQFLVATLSRAMLVNQTSLKTEDQTLLRGLPQGKLLLVADGMGGHSGGEHASQLAVTTVTRYVLDTMAWFFRLDADHQSDLFDELRAGIHRAHEALKQEGDRLAELHHMGTTLTMAYVLWPRMYVVHVGDSRCYRMRDGKLQQLTRDHTIAARLVADGTMEPEQAEDSRFSEVLWNAIAAGGDQELKVDVGRTRLAAGDVVLLCSDGLNKHVDDERIGELVRGAESSEEAVRSLVASANQAGGSDNITVVLGRFFSDQ